MYPLFPGDTMSILFQTSQLLFKVIPSIILLGQINRNGIMDPNYPRQKVIQLLLWGTIVGFILAIAIIVLTRPGKGPM